MTLPLNLPIRADSKDDAATYRVHRALQQAAYGNAEEVLHSAAEGLKLGPGNPGVAVQSALAYAMVGETARALALTQDLNERFPLDTQMQLLALPAIQAQVDLNRQQPDIAVNTLRASLPVELASTSFTSSNISCLYPTYIRGQAYLAAGQGAAAAAEFQKIIDHSGIVGNCWTGAIAYLGVARANVLQSASLSGDFVTAARTRANSAYDHFLALWKDADPEIPVLKQAKSEYQKITSATH
jgi:eukaryotic-like serine/threonine-protein kinase